MTLMAPFQWGNYNSFQFSLTKPARRGLSLIANYVFSKAIDNATAGGIGGRAGQSRDPFNDNLDKGVADYDATHRTNIALLYDIPGIASAHDLVGESPTARQFNAILSGRSGLPFSISGLNRSLTGVNRDNADQVGDPARPAGLVGGQVVQYGRIRGEPARFRGQHRQEYPPRPCERHGQLFDVQELPCHGETQSASSGSRHSTCSTARISAGSVFGRQQREFRPYFERRRPARATTRIEVAVLMRKK